MLPECLPGSRRSTRSGVRGEHYARRLRRGQCPEWSSRAVAFHQRTGFGGNSWVPEPNPAGDFRVGNPVPAGDSQIRDPDPASDDPAIQAIPAELDNRRPVCQLPVPATMCNGSSRQLRHCIYDPEVRRAGAVLYGAGYLRAAEPHGYDPGGHPGDNDIDV